MLPDEYRYWQPGPRVRPFHYRWLLPALCGQKLQRWKFTQAVGFLALAGLLGAYTGEWWAGVLLLGCSGITFGLKHPVMVDLPALALALGAAVLWAHGVWWAAVVLVLIAGCVKETGPVFATVFAWHPVLLIGLLPPLARCLMRQGTDAIPNGPTHEALEHPVRVSWEHHRELPVAVWVLPWGVLLAALANPSPQLWACLALAYGQLIIATDAVRVYQWAVPVMALCAVPMLTGPWLAVALLVHVVSPFKTQGV